MNSPAYLAMLRQEKTRADALGKWDALRLILMEATIAALVAVLVGLIAV